MRLLIAEDERELAKALKTIFEKHNYGVDVVYDGQEALDYALSGEYDGAVLDVMMPKIDGFEVVRRLRRRGVSTPVLLLTARSEIPDRVEGLDAGADDYLPKPFAMAELLARVRALVRRRERLVPEVVSFGGGAFAGFGHLYALLRRKQRAPGQPRIPDDGNADGKSPPHRLYHAVYGAYMGLGRGS